MGNEGLKKLFNGNNDALYNAEKSAEILKALNEAIHGLYYLDNEDTYVLSTLNATTYVEEEYKKLLIDIGTDFGNIANKLEMIRSLIFGDCFNWDNIYAELSKIPSKE